MEPNDVTVEILKNIRDEIRTTRGELSARVDDLRDSLSARIDDTNNRLASLERRQVEAEVRLATEVTQGARVLHDLRDDLRADRALRHRVDDLEQRGTRIEAHAPQP